LFCPLSPEAFLLTKRSRCRRQERQMPKSEYEKADSGNQVQETRKISS
jgi:hypothetical protein